MQTVIIIVFALLFTYLSWRNLYYALALICAFLPSYLLRFQIWFAPMTVLELMILIIFAVWLIQVVLKREKIRFDGWGWLLILFFVAATIAVFVSQSKIEAVGIWKAYFLEPILFFVVFINIIKEKTQLNLIFYAVEFSALYLSCLAIYQAFTGFAVPLAYQEMGRVTSLFDYSNALGLYLAPLSLLFIYLALKEILREGKKNILLFVFHGLCALLSVLAIYFARSEGGLIALVAGIIFLGLFYPNKRVKIVTLVAIFLLALSIAIIPLARNYTIEKLTLSDASGQIKKQQWKETWQMLDGNWQGFISGAGLANYQKAVAPYHQPGIWIKNGDPNWLEKIRSDAEYRKKVWQPTEIYLYPHNIILNFWSEIGLLGLVVFILIVLKYFWQGIRRGRDAKSCVSAIDQDAKSCVSTTIAMMGIMVVILVHGLVDVPYFKNDLSVLFWLFIGIMAVAARQKEQKYFGF